MGYDVMFQKGVPKKVVLQTLQTKMGVSLRIKVEGGVGWPIY